jgi:hypothetical protein
MEIKLCNIYKGGVTWAVFIKDAAVFIYLGKKKKSFCGEFIKQDFFFDSNKKRGTHRETHTHWKFKKIINLISDFQF